ncbi:MAG: tyrosine-type recombinase/integrase [Gammaproteobacteria bacterium]|nr:tyrosine-type recombinase/integrase [Gammaproteobacteria bacterium]
MTPLRKKMIDDMVVRGLSDHTIKSYIQAVTGLARHYNRSPDRIEPREVQDYLLFLLRDRELAWASCNLYRVGIRFFYRTTLGLPDARFFIPGSKQPKRLPEILNREELVRLFSLTVNRKHRALLMTAYAAGLRCSELIHLQASDIDSSRMLIRVEQGKGNKDRYVPLSPRLLEELRDYWRRCRPEGWMFPSYIAGRHMSHDGPWWIYQQARERAGITKGGGIHTLRHCYATNLIEAGVDLHDIQRRMGHTSPRTTMEYLHLAQGGDRSTPSPLDLLELPELSNPRRN